MISTVGTNAQMNGAERGAIVACKDDIVNDVQVVHIIDNLIKYNVIDEEERLLLFEPGIQSIKRATDWRRRQEIMRSQASKLIEVLQTKNAFQQLLRALEDENAYPWVAHKLRNAHDRLNKPFALHKMLTHWVNGLQKSAR